MTRKLDASQLRAAAKRALEERVELVPALLHAQEVSEASRATATVAERNHASAWNSAIAGGWTAKTLKELGLTEPNRKTAGRPRRATKTSTPQEPSKTEPPTETEGVQEAN